jgi:hypothetical protein
MNLDTTFGRHLLLPHPIWEPGAQADLVHDLSVAIARLSADRLRLTYRLCGDLDALKLPEPRSAARTDGLWRHTCFEAFIGHSGAGDYWEYNFSPSGAWAAYHFAGYREGMAPLLKGAPPDIVRNTGGETIELEVSLDLSWLTRSFLVRGLRLGLSAVIEDKAQVLSYWALKHPAEKPDFHHAGSFVVELD